MEIIILITIYIIAFFIDFLPIIKEKQTKDIIIYSVCLSVSFFILMWVTLGYNFPWPSKLIQTAVKSVFNINLLQ